jgi:hypothetical protein
MSVLGSWAPVIGILLCLVLALVWIDGVRKTRHKDYAMVAEVAVAFLFVDAVVTIDAWFAWEVLG